MITLTGMLNAIHINFTPVADLDMAGYVIHGVHADDLVGGDFTPADTNLLNRGVETNLLIPVSKTGQWYLKIAAYDTFGEDILNYTGLQGVVVPAPSGLDTQPPATPGAITCTSGVDVLGQTTTAYIEATWPANTDADLAGYLVQFRKVGTTWPLERNIVSPATRFTGLIPGAAYEIRVAAIDVYNNMSGFNYPSAPWKQVTASVSLTPPSTPSGLIATAGLKKVTCAWTANPESDLAGYELHASTVSGFTPNTGTLKFNGMSTVASFEGTAGTTYYVKVRAYNQSDLYSGYSTQASATSAAAGTADIAAGAVTADRLASSELITLSAQIKDAIITSAKIDSVSAAKVTTGVLGATTAITVGAENDNAITLDAASKSIKVTSGAVDRVQIGKLTGTSEYGVQIKDNTGNIVLRANGSDGAVIQNATIGNLVVGPSGVQCGSVGNSFKVWESDNVLHKASMYLGDYETTKLNYLLWDGEANELKIRGELNLEDATVGSLNLSWDGGSIKSGKTSYSDSSAGLWLGQDGTVSKLHLGNASKYVKWTGDDLIVSTGRATGPVRNAVIKAPLSLVEKYGWQGADYTVGLYNDGLGNYSTISNPCITLLGSSYVLPEFCTNTYILSASEAKPLVLSFADGSDENGPIDYNVIHIEETSIVAQQPLYLVAPKLTIWCELVDKVTREIAFNTSYTLLMNNGPLYRVYRTDSITHTIMGVVPESYSLVPSVAKWANSYYPFILTSPDGLIDRIVSYNPMLITTYANDWYGKSTPTYTYHPDAAFDSNTATFYQSTLLGEANKFNTSTLTGTLLGITADEPLTVHAIRYTTYGGSYGSEFNPTYIYVYKEAAGVYTEICVLPIQKSTSYNSYEMSIPATTLEAGQSLLITPQGVTSTRRWIVPELDFLVTPVGSMVYSTTEGETYEWNGTEYVKRNPTVQLIEDVGVPEGGVFTFGPTKVTVGTTSKDILLRHNFNGPVRITKYERQDEDHAWGVNVRVISGYYYGVAVSEDDPCTARINLKVGSTYLGAPGSHGVNTFAGASYTGEIMVVIERAY